MAAGGETAAPSGAVTLHPVRGAVSAGHGATGRRDRNGRCKPGFHASDRSVSPKPRQRVRRSLAGAPAAARRSRARRPDAVRQPGAEGARATGSRLTYCFTLIKPAIPLAVAYRDRRCRQRRGLKLPGQREPGVSPGTRSGQQQAGNMMKVSPDHPDRTYDTTATGKPGLQRRRRCFPLFRQAQACQGFFARADRQPPCCPYSFRRHASVVRRPVRHASSA